MHESGLNGGDYVEAYAGGAGVGIHLLLSGVAKRIHLNDLSRPVYCFWRTVLTQPEALCRRIVSASLTVEEWRRQREVFRHEYDCDELAVAFSLLYLNRCNRSGIPTGGLIGGLRQVGQWLMDARFPRNELVRRIEVIAAHKHRIAVKNSDAEKFLTGYVSRLSKKTLIYCDPPYYRKADRLYLDHYGPDDHRQLARTIQRSVKCPWIVSYDSAPEVIRHYAKRRKFVYDQQYNAARAYKGAEVFIMSDDVRIPQTSAVPFIATALKGAAR